MEYERVFLPLADTQASLAAFMTATMEDTETVGQWHARCKANYLHAFPDRTDLFAEQDHMLRFRFIAGLPSYELRKTVTQQRARTYAQTKIDAEDMYASLQGDFLTQGGGASASGGDAGTARIKREIMAVLSGTPSSKKRGWQGGRRNTACYECGEEGHVARECRQRRKREGQSGENRGGRGGRGGFGRGSRSRGRGGVRGRGGRASAVPGVHALGEEEEGGDWTGEELEEKTDQAEN